jgi:hypothetical protein
VLAPSGSSRPVLAPTSEQEDIGSGGTEGAWVNLTQQHRDEPRSRDDGSIVIGWMTKLVITAAIVGTLGFDGIAVGVGHLSTADDASNAAQSASQTFEVTHNLTLAFNAARGSLKPQESLSSKGFAVAADGTATVTVTNTVHTLVFQRTSVSKAWTVITAHATGKYTGT